MSRTCKACVLKEPLEEWKMPHVCKLNNSVSAGNMEPVRAKRIWEHSLQKTKLNISYLHFMVMVTAKAFQLLKIHILGITVQKLECVGYVQRRVGCRL